MPTPRHLVILATILAAAGLALARSDRADATVVPPNFSETTVVSGLSVPTAFRFAPAGRIFVAEKRGIVKVFDGAGDPTPTTVADIRNQVHNYTDRGLLAIELAGFPASPFVYLLYTLDAPIGGTPPRWGDACPNPPGETNGCVVGSRLSRIPLAGNQPSGPEQVLIEDWCQQYNTHSVGDVRLGPDGALYVSAGEGASPSRVDYGQGGDNATPTPTNPCGDPPVPAGGTQSAPLAEGGALRSQDLLTTGDPTTLDGAIIRVDPATGAAFAGNPLLGGPVAHDDRVVAHGLRNPFRFTFRPGAGEIWIGDVGWGTWEEIDRVPSPTDATVENFGWPCYEGAAKQPGYDSANLNLCEGLYSGSLASAVRGPYYAYSHSSPPAGGAACGSQSSSISGITFYPGGAYPSQYTGALIFGDYARGCIWAMHPGPDGLPNTADVSTLVTGAAPVQIGVGPDGDVYYLDLAAGRLVRIQYTAGPGNRPPTAVVAADRTSGPSPLTVHFDGRGSSDPDGDPITGYSWDLNGDGAFGDSTSPTPTMTYTGDRTILVRLRVTDSKGWMSAPAVVSVTVGNTAPSAAITSPAAAWSAGGSVAFGGQGTDPEDGPLPASALAWEVVLFHCGRTGGCHQHPLQQIDGVASGSFTAPDHGYPVYLELRLTVTDSRGLTGTAVQRLDPRTTKLTFLTVPPGLEVAVGSEAGPTPFVTDAIVGSVLSVSATTPQARGGLTYQFAKWSDGGRQAHDVIAPAAPATLVATYSGPGGAVTGAPAACRRILRGTARTDTIRGTAASERLIGLGAADRLLGRAGRDCLFGGPGADLLAGQAGADALAGGTGGDRLFGGAGDDALDGGSGDDLVSGGSGRDTLAGGSGRDALLARDGVRETVRCGPGRDVAIVDRLDLVRGCEVVRRR